LDDKNTYIKIREKKEKQLKREAYEKRAQEETKLRKKEAEDLINQLAASKNNNKLDEIIQQNRQKKKKDVVSFQKIRLVQVQVDDDVADETIDMESEADNFNPMEELIDNNQVLQVDDAFLYSCRYSYCIIYC
jgi:hypothetical protein